MSQVIDSHAHLWRAGDGLRPWLAQSGLERINRTFTADELCARSSLAGVDGVILVEGGASHASDTATLRKVASRSERFVGVVAWVDIVAPDLRTQLDEILEDASAGRVIGVRTQVQEETDDYLESPIVKSGIATVGDAGLPFELVLRPSQRSSALALITGQPATTFIVDHLGAPVPGISGRPAPGWQRWMAELARRSNVVVKLSGLPRTDHGRSGDIVRRHVDVALDTLGPSRLLWGSDWPVSLLHSSYARTFALAGSLVGALSAGERAQVFGQTAERVYGLRSG